MTATAKPAETKKPLELDLAEAEALPEEVSQLKIVLRRLFRHKLAVASMVVWAIILLLTIFAPYITPYKPTGIKLNETFAAPGVRDQAGNIHLLGTDQLGRDYLTRILYAARISLTVAATAQASVSIIGILIGALAGYFGGWLDALLMRFVEFLLTLPTLPILLIISSLLLQNVDAIPVPAVLQKFVGWLLIIPPRNSVQVILVIIILVALGWMGDSRLMRGGVLSVREQTFTEAARALGASDLRIILRHMVPNALAPMIVSASLGLGGFIIYEAALSFLGFGIQEPTPTWGNMLAAAQSNMFQHPWLPLISGTPIVICTLTINFIGDGLRDALDPRLKL